MKGDVNNDGRITTSDALMAFQIALGIYQPTPDEEWRADANNDGRVTTSDALCIFQEALGIPNSCFPKSSDYENFEFSKEKQVDTLNLEYGNTPNNYIKVDKVLIENGEVLQFFVYLNSDNMKIQDLQFDILYDTNTLSYLEGNFKLGDLIQKWAIYDDNLIEVGHIRFGAFDWYKGINPGDFGSLIVFKFAVIEGALSDNNNFKHDIINPT